MENDEKIKNENNNLLYIEKLNYEIQNIETNYIKEHYQISQLDENKIGKILEKIRLYKKNNTPVDNIFF